MKPTGMIHYAKLDSSPRLQRVLAYLRQCGSRGATTRDIVQAADVCAVSSAVDELRANGFDIDCKRETKSIFRYTLIEEGQGRLFGVQ